MRRTFVRSTSSCSDNSFAVDVGSPAIDEPVDASVISRARPVGPPAGSARRCGRTTPPARPPGRRRRTMRCGGRALVVAALGAVGVLVGTSWLLAGPRGRPCLRLPGRAGILVNGDGARGPSRATRSGRSPRLHHGDVSIARYVDALIDAQRRHGASPSGRPCACRDAGGSSRAIQRGPAAIVRSRAMPRVSRRRHQGRRLRGSPTEATAIRRRRAVPVVCPPLHHLRAGR